MDDLKKRLRAVEGGDPTDGEGQTHYYRNPDGPEAADRIEELEAALKFYAQKLVYVPVAGGQPAIERDNGDRARKALGEDDV